jgi:DNA-binding LacI/PurR family transcriptional regulator
VNKDTERRAPTLEDVARVAGVSRATVSRVINGVSNVDPGMHEAVWQAIDATGYVPNRMARSLVTRRTGTVALVVSEAERRTPDDPFLGRFFTDPFFGRVVGGLLSALTPDSVQLALVLAGTDRARTRLIGDLRQGQADGVVVISLHPGDPFPRQLADAAIPAVLYGRPARPTPINYVDVDNQAGARLAAERLVRCHCVHIATISGSNDMPAGADRLSAFRNEMAHYGYPFTPSEEGHFTRESGEQAMRRLLAAYPDIDGVFVANDLMAQGALDVLRDHGRRVPEDVAVIGFDDSSAATASRPRLTTIRQPVEDMAAGMGRLLLDQIEQPDHEPTSVIFQPRLVERESG